MNLKTYLKAEGVTLQEFGERLGRNASTISRWANGESFPRKNEFALIAEHTAGAVTVSDFIDAADTPEAAA